MSGIISFNREAPGNPLQQFSKFFLGDLGAGAAPALSHLQLTAIGIRLNRIQVFHLSLFEEAANG